MELKLLNWCETPKKIILNEFVICFCGGGFGAQKSTERTRCFEFYQCCKCYK